MSREKKSILNTVNHSDCLSFVKNCNIEVDAVVTDPPYGIGYQNNKWDEYKDCISFQKETWQTISSILKPGGYLIVFGGPKTFHRLFCALEDAGLDIKDELIWLYGQGMPKSVNIGKKLPDWQGWGTGLKPCYEPIALVQKPNNQKTIVKNVEQNGVGALNIDVCRVDNGRWPGNVLHDGSEDVESQFAEFGERGNGWSRNYGVEDYQGRQYKGGVFGGGGFIGNTTYCDTGTASRFFYSTKTSVKEKTHNRTIKNDHPTVKPIALMKYLISLVTPPNGIVFDPFTGSGTTLLAAKELGFQFIGTEMDQHYVDITKQRLNSFPSSLEKFL